MKNNSLLQYASVAALLLCSQLSHAGWTLDNKQSQLNFVSIKKSKVAELHYFKVLNGSLNDKGEAKISIDLASVETNIGIRNERMQTMLFESDAFPKATITGMFDANRIKNLKSGEHFNIPQQVELSLHGRTQVLTGMVKIVKLTKQEVLVTTLQPIIVKADDFALLAGIEKLREIAGLPSIATSVPVTFSFVFKTQNT